MLRIAFTCGIRFIGARAVYTVGVGADGEELLRKRAEPPFIATGVLSDISRIFLTREPQ